MSVNGLYECFNCLHNSVIWEADFDFDDYGLDGAGVVHECRCLNCGARITYECPCDNLDDENMV